MLPPDASYIVAVLLQVMENILTTLKLNSFFFIHNDLAFDNLFLISTEVVKPMD